MTFVALGEDNKPAPTAPVIPETEDEHRRFDNAMIRRNARLPSAIS